MKKNLYANTIILTNIVSLIFVSIWTYNRYSSTLDNIYDIICIFSPANFMRSIAVVIIYFIWGFLDGNYLGILGALGCLFPTIFLITSIVKFIVKKNITRLVVLCISIFVYYFYLCLVYRW
ncbi:MAG: hypothetical protein Ta2B_19730 [Termitinemataceae bacterium]|nr:MAG: hypothetical protein Ta2B_19730 [Termitinemataceae bacterium]